MIDTSNSSRGAQPRSRGSNQGWSWTGLAKSAALLWLAAGSADTRVGAQSVWPGMGNAALPKDPLRPLPQVPHLPRPVPAAASPVAALPAAALPVTEAFETESSATLGGRRALQQHSHPHRAVGVTRRHVRPKRPHPAYEVVVSRHDQDVSWVFKLPVFWKITVYSTAPSAEYLPWPKGTHPQGDYNVIDIPPRPYGHEKVGYAHHLVSRFDTLADYTVFSPSFPLEQSPSLIQLMSHPGMLSTVQTMSTQVTPSFPPADIKKHYSQDPWFRSDRFSVRTLEPLFFDDPFVNEAALDYARFSNLTDGANLMSHYFADLGLGGWVPEEQEVGSFAYGSIFGVGRKQVLQHRVEVYEKLQHRLQEHPHTSLVAERSWLMLFGGCDYIDKAPERW